MARNRSGGIKLTRDDQFQVCMWFAEMRGYQEIVDLLAQKNISVTRKAIWEMAHRAKWIPVINRLKHGFLTNLATIPIANKSVRLRRLETMYHHTMTIREDGQDIDIKSANKCIEQARKEIEGDRGDTYIDKVEQHTHLTLATIVKEHGKHADSIIRALRGQGADRQVGVRPDVSAALDKPELGDINIL